MNKYQKFYKKNGYLVIHNLISKNIINNFNNFFHTNIIEKPNLRFSLMDKQKIDNIKINNGYLQNPLGNVHCIKYLNSKYKKFGDECLKIISSKKISNILNKIYHNENFDMLMSMLFDQNAGTPAHQDCYYLDSFPHGNMTAAWIALEDIKLEAGRFYVIPKSQNLDIQLSKAEIKNPNKYEKKIEKLIKKKKLKIKAPILKKGSVLFWNSGTIHGSLKTINNLYSRKSFTCHFIPSNLKFVRNRYSDEIRRYNTFKSPFNDNIKLRIVNFNNSNIKNKYISRSIKNFNKQNFERNR